MNEYVIAIITGITMAAIATIAIWILHLKHKKDRAKWEQIAENNYEQGKDEAYKIVRSTCDQIEEDKTKLSELSDRELLIETMLALGSYGRRIDHIDAKLKCITNYRVYIDDMNRKTHTLSQSFSTLEESISTTAAVIDGLQQMIQETSINIHKLIVDLGSLTNLHTKISNHVSDLNGVEEMLSYLHGNISAVVEDMENIMSTYDEPPMVKLSAIQSEIEDLTTVVSSVRGDLENISDTTEKIKSIVADSADEYEYNSLCYRMADLSSKMGNLENEISSTSEKVTDIKATVENSLNHYGYDSLHNKLDDISSSVTSIRYKVNA